MLTIISTIFIPLTFIAGVYGMNFAHMPELEWEYGYPVVLSIMLFIGLLMVRYFRKKQWL
ncbi:MAG: magnesium Mg(2+)/cobalt Co(2+) transport protein [Firmicutes bacterium]|nr:magnesium Mg(2+)/cobalt Co(2+) transport protein [Bacillota bacterium]